MGIKVQRLRALLSLLDRIAFDQVGHLFSRSLRADSSAAAAVAACRLAVVKSHFVFCCIVRAQAIVFTNDRDWAEEVAATITERGLSAAFLSGAPLTCVPPASPEL